MRRSSSSARVALCCAVIALGASALPRRAFAEEPPTSLVSKGLELRRERRDGEALKLFQAAYAGSPQPMILGQVALAEQALGRWPSAEQDLNAVLATHDGWVEANRSALEKALAVIQSHLSSLNVTTNIDTAELWLDNQDLGKVGAATLRVAAGAHELSLRAADGRAATRSVTLGAGEREHFHLEFLVETPTTAPTPAAAPRRTTAEPSPSATSSPPKALAPVTPSPARGLSTRQAFAYGSAGLAVVALGEAVTASLLRLHYAHRYNSEACAPNRSQQCGPYRDDANTWGDVALVGYVVAGIAGLSSVGLFTAPYWYPKTSSSGAQGGIAFSGRF